MVDKDRINTEVNILIHNKKERGTHNHHWFLEFQNPVQCKKCLLIKFSSRAVALCYCSSIALDFTLWKVLSFPLSTIVTILVTFGQYALLGG